MLSGKLIRLIETHAEEIALRVVGAIRRNPDCLHLAAVPEEELWDRCREILKNLGHWLEYANEEVLDREYEALGKLRHRESVPLYECLHGLYLMKDGMNDFVHEQGVDRDCVALYAEEELERRVGRFFDLLAIHMARGYEIAWRHAMHAYA
jgi:hypothetical protein